MVTETTWARKDVVVQIKNWFDCDYRKEYGTVLRLLKKTFDPNPALPSEAKVRSVSTTKISDRGSFHFRTTPASQSAPDFCALLVAMNKSINQAVEAFRNTCDNSEPIKVSSVRSGKRKITSPESEGLAEACNSRVRLRLERCLALTEAFHDVMSDLELPQKIYAHSLGRLAGLSEDQATVVISAHRFLRKAIINANDDLYRRRIVWASNVLRAQGEVLTKDKIRQLARLPLTPKASAVFLDFSLHEGKLRFGSKSPALDR